MKSTSIKHFGKELQSRAVGQPRWQRIILLIVLGYEGAGGMLGGCLLIAAPGGQLMDMPVEIMHGVFGDFLIPGIILLGLGILNTVAFIGVLRRTPADWVLAGLAMGGFLIWFIVEIIILQQLHWLHAMWGLPVVMGGLFTIPMVPAPNTTMRKALLICGILSSLLYAGLNIFVPMQWETYDVASQTVSELSAVDAPTRLLWVLLCLPFTLLVTAFALGVLSSAGTTRSLRIAGYLLITYGVLGIIWPFAPMHLREVLAAGGETWSDTMHITLAIVTEILYFLAMGFAAAALGKQFRIYSITTFLTLLVFGVLTFMEAPGVSANQPTPLIGVWERINIGVFLLWVIVLAVILLRRENKPDLT